MNGQKSWRIKMAIMFGVFVLGGMMLPFLPVSVRGYCLFEKILGIPCPFCGIRSSIYALLMGDLSGVWQYNLLGPVVWAVCVILGGYFTFSVATEKGLAWSQEIIIFKRINQFIYGLLLFQWILKLIYL